MGILRSVGGWGEVDLDQRAITTDDDIVDLSELDSHDPPNQPAPTTQNGAAEQDEPGEEQPPTAAAISADRAPGEAPPANEAPGREGDEDFDRWAADRLPGLATARAASKPITPPLASDARDPASGDAPTAASRAAGVPCDEPTVAAVTRSRSPLRRARSLSLPLGGLARPAAAIAAVTLTVGGTAIAIVSTVGGAGTKPRRPALLASASARAFASTAAAPGTGMGIVEHHFRVEATVSKGAATTGGRRVRRHHSRPAQRASDGERRARAPGPHRRRRRTRAHTHSSSPASCLRRFKLTAAVRRFELAAFDADGAPRLAYQDDPVNVRVRRQPRTRQGRLWHPVRRPSSAEDPQLHRPPRDRDPRAGLFAACSRGRLVRRAQRPGWISWRS